MFDFSKDSNIFDEEERVILNHNAIGISREACCEQLAFNMAVTSDNDCVQLLQALYAKVRDLSDEEWEDLQKYLPFEVSFSDEDNIYNEAENLDEVV